MKTAEKKLAETLDPAGLALVFRGTLGRAEMVRIANASRVSVPGMRNRAVSLEHLSEALADKFVAEGPARRTILKALQNSVRSGLPAYRKLDLEEIRARLSDGERVRADAEVGKLIYMLISEPREGLGTDEIRAAVTEASRSWGKGEPEPGGGPPVDTELHAMRREKAELSRRAADLVGLVDRLRERDRRFREEIAQRKFDVNNLKLQLAKSRKERDSLEKELRTVTAKLEQADRKPAPPSDLSEKLSATLNETRRLAALVDKLQGRIPQPERPSASSPLATMTKTLDDVRREVGDLRKLALADQARMGKAIEEAAVRAAEKTKSFLEPPQTDAQRRGSVDRVGVFVDVQNMFYAARGQGARLDFDILLQTATRGRRLIRAVAYVVEAKEIDQSGFIALLQQKRYEVKRKDLKVRADGSFKGDWDMEIALDALEMAGAVDVVVLVTGDGDFTSLVQKLKIRGPRVEVYSFPQNTAKELREAADRFVSIDKRMLIKTSRLVPRPSPTGTAGS